METESQSYGKRYRINFIEPGIMNYDDINAGTVLVQRSALDRMRDSFIGKPLVNEDHIDLDPGQAYKKDDKSNPQADGIVYAVGTDPETGWDYADVIIWNEDTLKNIEEKGYSASCAYTPKKVDPNGGVWHNFPYNEEVIDGEYNHMAIVDNPRYERVTIYPNNKGEPMAKKKIFKLLGKKPEQKTNMAPPEPEEKELEKMNMDGAVIEVDGEMIPLEEAIAAYQQQKQNEVTPLSPDDEIEIEGEPEKVKVADLIAALQASRQNVGEPKDIKAELDVQENACGSGKKQNSKPPEEKKNANFRLLENAANKTAPVDPRIKTKAERIKQGKMRYGSAQKPKEVTA